MTRTLRPLFFLALLVPMVCIPACGGGGDGSGTGTGNITLAVTDAPIDGAAHVVVRFTGVELQPAGGGRLSFVFDTARDIDLLTLQGNASQPLLDQVEVPAGNYNWIRLLVEAQRGVLDSFIELDDGSQASLFIPSGAQRGLQLSSGFTVAQGGLTDFVIDFDLRKSVHLPENGDADYYLRPSLRLLDRLEVGSLSGTVAADLITDADCTNGPNHDEGNAVYLYAGSDVVPDDVGSQTQPLASAIVHYDDSSNTYVYHLGFVAAGDYTVAFTCQAAGDDPGTDDDIAFTGAANVSVTANEDSVHDF